jgi:hypothetical protein
MGSLGLENVRSNLPNGKKIRWDDSPKSVYDCYVNLFWEKSQMKALFCGCLKNRLSQSWCGVAILLCLLPAIAEGAVIIAANPLEGIVYTDLTPTEKGGFDKGDRIVFFVMPGRSKFFGKVTQVIQQRRLVIEVEGGVFALRLGSTIDIKRKQGLKRLTNNTAVVDRRDDTYAERRNLSVLGGGGMANSKIGLSDAVILFGGGMGISLPWDLELEGHFWMGSLAGEKYTVDFRYFGGEAKKFLSNAFYAFAGGGMRSVTITGKGLVAQAKNSETDPEAGALLIQVAGTDSTDPQDPALPNEHFSDDVVAGVGAGFRVQIPTVLVGRSMIFGVDAGFWSLVSVLEATQGLNPALDAQFGLPGMTFFSRIYTGFGF